jgi:uncharacterized membrane protein YdjX (TVP38/TMEM64 family)
VPRRRVLAGLTVIAGAAVAVRLLRSGWLARIVPEALGVVERAGSLGPVLFVALYVVLAQAFAPVGLFTMAAGALFGLVPGTSICYLSAVVAASLSFVTARSAGRRVIERYLGKDRRISAIDRAIGERGLTISVLLRLSPVIPFTVLNYSLGLTRIRFRDFLLGSVGMIPAVFMYASAGAAAGELMSVLTGARPARSTQAYVLLCCGLAATVAVTWFVTRLARNALHASHLDE